MTKSLGNHLPSVIIGAGAVGLACARLLSSNGFGDIFVIERNSSIGAETSSRNSEVIHAGLYNVPSSLKADLCVKGNLLLYSYLEKHSIDYQRCGKLIVATEDSQLGKLEHLFKQAKRNGVNTKILDRDSVRKLEPNVTCTAAIFSDSTGILNSHEFLAMMKQEAENFGVSFALNCNVTSVTRSTTSTGCRFVIHTNQGSIEANTVINAAGLSAPFVARRIGPYPLDRIPRAFYAKGTYFKLVNDRAPFSRLIYPLPEVGGLGIHATIDTGGSVKFGPDVQWLHPTDRTTKGDEVNDDVQEYEHGVGPPIDYMVDDARKEDFLREIRKYWPGASDDCIVPDYAGIRPKLLGPHDSVRGGCKKDKFGRDLGDFVIEGPRDHGISGLINLFGIESPGLTSCLAIAKHVHQLLIQEDN